MKGAIVHEYYKLEREDMIILIQIDPIHLTGVELVVTGGRKMQKNKRQFDEDIYEDLKVDGFVKANPLEFNLYLKGLKSI